MPLTPFVVPIPHEIVLEIVDILAQQSDYRTLTTLSLVHRALLKPCRSQVFHSITLGPRPGRGKSVCDIIKALNSSPYLSEYIRDLHILDHAGPTQIHWLHTDIYLAKLLPRLNHLSSLKLKFTGRMFVWNVLLSGSRRAISDIMEKEGLISLDLSGIYNFPGQLLCFNPKLKRLALRSMLMTPVIKPSGSHKVHLDSLTLESSGMGSFVQECPNIDLGGLKSFSVRPSFPSEVERAKEIMQCASTTISSFSWEGTQNIVSPAPIVLSNYPSLQTVKYQSTLSWDDMTNEPPQFYLNECIRFLRSTWPREGEGNQIRDVVIVFDCSCWPEIPEGILSFLCNEPGWERLADVLSERRCFPALKRISMQVLLCHSGETISEWHGLRERNRKREKERYEVSDIPHLLRRQLRKLDSKKADVGLDISITVNGSNQVY